MSRQDGDVLVQEAEDLRQWRRQVSEFCAGHLPVDIARKVELGFQLEKHDYVRWQKILHQNGLFAGAWPREFGGQGWDLLKQLVFVQETAICNAPMIMPYGVNMVGPVIYTFGTEAQRREHLPGILSSEVWWCQGYSEPGAGSDLASLRTFAERDGDQYVVTGSKMWTTEAHWADKMHCLVRTSREGKPQNGISFLLIDMNTPGITVQPIVTIDGQHHTNQVFLDGVRVPARNRVGDEGQGWAIAKFLLGNERTSIADTGPKLRLLRHLKVRHRDIVADAAVSASRKALLTSRLADVEIQLLTLCALERSYVASWSAGQTPSADASLLKIRGTEILQALAELAMELEGPMAFAHDPSDLHGKASDDLGPAVKASLIAHEYLYSRCWSIFGGTNEIQRNIIARQILGSMD
jgi:alkylation response protein AidB-like acyl-CoA dehydrogenase